MIRRNRKVLGFLAACAVGALCKSGCAEFYTNAALNSIDFCSVFNCEGGTFFNLCSPYPILADCPNAGTADEAE